MRPILYALLWAVLALTGLPPAALADTTPKRVRDAVASCSVRDAVSIRCPSGIYIVSAQPGSYDSFRFDSGVFKILAGRLVEVDPVTGQPVASAPGPIDAGALNDAYARGYADAKAAAANAIAGLPAPPGR